MKLLGADDIQADNLRLKADGLIRTFTAGNAVVAGDLCCLNSSGQMVDADADAEGTSTTLLAIALETIGATSSGLFLLRGYIATGTWTTNSKIWVSQTPAAMTATAPTGSGVVRRIVGYSLSTSEIWFCPDNTWIVNA